MPSVATVSSMFTSQLQLSWLWRRDVVWLLLIWELTMMLLAVVFPVALLELCFGMLGLPILLFVLAPNDGRRDEEDLIKSPCEAVAAPAVVDAGGDGAGRGEKPAGGPNALPNMIEVGVHMRSLLICLGLVFAVNLLPLVVNVSSGLVEACTVVLFVILGHLLLSKSAMVHSMRQAQKADKKEEAAEDKIEMQHDVQHSMDRDGEENTESIEWMPHGEPHGEINEMDEPKPEDLGYPYEAQPVANEVQEDLDQQTKTARKLVWADVEEDEFQQTLARNQPEYKNFPAASDGGANGSGGRADGARSEGPRRSAGGKRRKDGGGGKAGGKGSHKEEGQHQHQHSAASPYTAKIRACGRAGDLAGALEAVEEALASGLPNNSEVQNALLYALVHCGEAAGTSAPELFAQMKETKQADVVSFNIMLRAFLDADQHDKAKELLHDMAEFGLSANKVTLNELLGDRVKAGDRAGMWRVVDEMKATGFGITNVACSLLLKSLAVGTARDEVRKTLALMDDLVEPMDEALCSSAIEACLRVKELDLASSFMSSLSNIKAKNRSSGLSPATYGSMIKAHGQARDLEQTWATWNAMFKNGASPSAVTFGCMVEALVMNGAVDDAWKLVHEMLSNEEHSECVNTVIYSTVMKGFSHARRPEQCFAVLDEMHARGVEANTITYNTLLDACAKCSSMTRVPEVFEEMKRSQIEPDKITYSTLIKGYCMVGELDCAFDLFEEMKADGKVGLDEIVYNALIDGCGRQQKVSRALQVLADMKKAKISPSNYTLSILVKLLGRAHKLNEAIALVDDFRANYRVRPNVQVYTCLMQACLLNKRVGQAMTVYNKMVKELQCLPDQKAFSVLLNGCIQVGALKEAVQAARCAYCLPAEDLATPDSSREEIIGVEHKIMATLQSKLRQQHVDADVVKQWDEVLEKSGFRSGRGNYGHSGGHGDERSDRHSGYARQSDDRGRKGSGRQKGKGKGKDSRDY